MKITINGRPGSGKSTIGKKISKKFGLEFYSTGDLMGELAQEQGTTVEQFVQGYPEEIDRMIDARTQKIGKKKDNILFDSRLAFHFVPDSVKIFLYVTDEEGAKRIFQNQRKDEARAKNISELAQRNAKRWENDRNRYISLYGIDMNTRSYYDAWIDTTKMTRQEVLTQISQIIVDKSQRNG